MNTDEFYNFEDQVYVNPTLSSGEQMAFIDKFRDIQNQNNQQIATDTYNLGKALPSNLGGLGGGESYFNARYQTDQVDDMVANLKTAAQAQEFNDVMSNYQKQLKRRYTKAHQAYNRRHANNPNSNDATKGGIEHDYTDDETVTLQGALSAGTTPELEGEYGRVTTVAEDLNGQYYSRRDDNGNIIYTNMPGYKKGDDGYYHPNSWFKNKVESSVMANDPVAKLTVALNNLIRR